MENGLSELHLISLPAEVNSLRIVDAAQSNFQNVKSSRSQTPSTLKKSHELMFIDDGTLSSSSSIASTKDRENNLNYNEKSGDHPSTSRNPTSETPSPPLPSPPSPSICDSTPATSRRLPTVVVLGYQRVVAESQAAAERMHHHQQLLRQSPHLADCALTLNIGSSGLVDHGLPTSPHGRNSRVKCPPSDDLHYFAHPPPPQSSPTNSSDDISFSSPDAPSTSSVSSVPISAQESASSNQSASKSPLSSSPPDAGSLWPMLVSRPVAEDAESIAESVYHQPPKAADRSAAYRLARRLFTLDGFKITDVAKHLCKRNDFSQLVGEEFASFFDFTEQGLDTALRTFMTKFALTGESQERERILFHFSRRYCACNPGAFVSSDACYTLVTALMLLNADLHSQNVTKKMSCQEFVDNLMNLKNEENGYSPEELKRLYEAFKQEPLRWPVMEMPAFNLMYGGPPVGSVAPMLPSGVYGFGLNGMATPNGVGFVSTSPIVAATPSIASSSAASPGIAGATNHSAPPYWQPADPSLFGTWAAASTGGSGGSYLRPAVFTPQPTSLANPASTTCVSNSSNSNPEGGGDFLKLFTNPFADMPKGISAKEYMRGFLMRKCVMESHSKRTGMGKRSWKLFYGRLRDLMLYLYKDAETAAMATRSEELALGYMKQVYRFQLHCQHLRFYHERQQRLQTPLAPANVPSSLNDESSLITVSTEKVQQVNEKKEETMEGDMKIDQEGNEKNSETEGEQLSALTPTPNGTSTMPSFLDQQLAAAAFQLPPPPPPPPPPECVICIAHAFASVAEDYLKKPNVFRLKTKDGSEYLMQVNDSKELDYWIDKINYVAGLLSAPSLPSAVGSDQTFHRPILPGGVTHLGVHEQLEGHQRRVLDLTRDLTELKRRRLSAPSQPNLTSLFPESAAPSPAPSIRSDSAVPPLPGEKEANQQLQPPPFAQLSYIPDSVLKSLQPPSAATLPSSATSHPERSLSAFSTASLGRRRKKSFSTFRGGSGSELAVQRAEWDERVAFLEQELTRYKTYSRLLEAELTRLQHLPPQTLTSQPSPSGPVYSTPQNIRALWQVCGSTDLPEEPSGNDGGKESSVAVEAALPPSAKRGYTSVGFGFGTGMKHSRTRRIQYRQYQMQRRQQQQLQFYSPCLPLLPPTGFQTSHRAEETSVTTESMERTSQDPQILPTAFYEVL